MTLSLPAHTPYDGTSKPFTIGLKPLDLDTWIEIDATYDGQMAEKRRLFATRFGEVFVEEDGTAESQCEVRDSVIAHVLARFPERFSRTDAGVAIAGQATLTDSHIAALPPLHAASLLVQEDLILMRKGPDGWRLAAGALCFPSSWSLNEKFGKPLEEIHAPVPGFGRGTRSAELIQRMFDRLQPGNPVERMNWSLQAQPVLYYPLSNNQRIDRANNRPGKFADLAAVARGFIRVERQTLRKMPESGDILFTIRIYLDPLALFATHPDGARLAASFSEQLMAMEESQLDYKGLTADRNRLASYLGTFSQTGGGPS